MIDTLKIFEELQKTLEPSAARAIANTFTLIYEDLQNTVTKTEFNELKGVVRELAEAQKRTEKELHALVKEHKETRRQLGGLTMVVGYTLFGDDMSCFY